MRLLKAACASACIDAEMSCFSWTFTTSGLARRRVLAAHLPALTPGMAPLQRALSGSVLRPWCHFELPVSGYLAQGRLPCFSCIQCLAPLNYLSNPMALTWVSYAQDVVCVRQAILFRYAYHSVTDEEAFWLVCLSLCDQGAGMRPESSGGARVTSVLDSATKVLEISSLGVKVRPVQLKLLVWHRGHRQDTCKIFMGNTVRAHSAP